VNKSRSGFGKYTDALKPFARLHAKKNLGLSAAVQNAVTGKEIAFAFQREIFRQSVTEAPAKTIIRVTVMSRNNGSWTRRDNAGQGCYSYAPRRDREDRKLAANFKLLVIRLST
jgi:hypothetical protein